MKLKKGQTVHIETFDEVEEPLQKSYGSWQGLPIIAIGKLGGKIVGYGPGGKPIYAGSSEGQKLVQANKAKTLKGKVVAWLQALGFNIKTSGDKLAVGSPSEALQIKTAFNLQTQGSTVVFSIKELGQYVGKPVIQDPTGEAAEQASPDLFPEDLSKLKATGQTLGSHSSPVLKGPKGEKYLFKGSDQKIARAEEAVSRIGNLLMPNRVQKAKYVKLNGKNGTLIRFAEGYSPIGKESSSMSVSTSLLQKFQKHFDEIVQHHVIDWLCAQHDAHGDNIGIVDGHVYAIDKGQAWRFLGQDALPSKGNESSNAANPNPSKQVYSQFWKAFHDGKLKGDPVKAASVVLSRLASISDEQFEALVMPYVEAASGPSTKQKLLDRIMKRKKETHSNWEWFLGKDIPVTQEAASGKPTKTKEAGPEKIDVPPVDQPAAPAPKTTKEHLATIFQPIKKGTATLLMPGDPDDKPFGANYPGNGFRLEVKYKKEAYTVQFAGGKVYVTYPDQTILEFLSPNEASDSLVLWSKNLDMNMSASEKKKKGISYPATKMFKLKEFGDALEQYGMTPAAPPPPEKGDELTVAQMLKDHGNGLIKDKSFLPPALQEFAMASGANLYAVKMGPMQTVWASHVVDGEVENMYWATGLTDTMDGPFASTSWPSELTEMGIKPAAPPKPMAPKAEPVSKETKLKKPADAPEYHEGPLPVHSTVTVQKKFAGAKTKMGVKLTAKPGGKFTVEIPGAMGHVATFDSLSAASDHVWVNQKGYEDVEDYKKKTGKKKVASGGGWKFWGLKPGEQVQAKPAPKNVTEAVSESNFETMPESEPGTAGGADFGPTGQYSGVEPVTQGPEWSDYAFKLGDPEAYWGKLNFLNDIEVGKQISVAVSDYDYAIDATKKDEFQWEVVGVNDLDPKPMSTSVLLNFIEKYGAKQGDTVLVGVEGEADGGEADDGDVPTSSPADWETKEYSVDHSAKLIEDLIAVPVGTKAAVTSTLADAIEVEKVGLNNWKHKQGQEYTSYQLSNTILVYGAKNAKGNIEVDFASEGSLSPDNFETMPETKSVPAQELSLDHFLEAKPGTVFSLPDPTEGGTITATKLDNGLFKVEFGDGDIAEWGASTTRQNIIKNAEWPDSPITITSPSASTGTVSHADLSSEPTQEELANVTPGTTIKLESGTEYIKKKGDKLWLAINVGTTFDVSPLTLANILKTNEWGPGNVTTEMEVPPGEPPMGKDFLLKVLEAPALSVGSVIKFKDDTGAPVAFTKLDSGAWSKDYNGAAAGEMSPQLAVEELNEMMAQNGQGYLIAPNEYKQPKGHGEIQKEQTFNAGDLDTNVLATLPVGTEGHVSNFNLQKTADGWKVTLNDGSFDNAPDLEVDAVVDLLASMHVSEPVTFTTPVTEAAKEVEDNFQTMPESEFNPATMKPGSVVKLKNQMGVWQTFTKKNEAEWDHNGESYDNDLMSSMATFAKASPLVKANYDPYADATYHKVDFIDDEWVAGAPLGTKLSLTTQDPAGWASATKVADDLWKVWPMNGISTYVKAHTVGEKLNQANLYDKVTVTNPENLVVDPKVLAHMPNFENALPYTEVSLTTGGAPWVKLEDGLWTKGEIAKSSAQMVDLANDIIGDALEDGEEPPVTVNHAEATKHMAFKMEVMSWWMQYVGSTKMLIHVDDAGNSVRYDFETNTLDVVNADGSVGDTKTGALSTVRSIFLNSIKKSATPGYLSLTDKYKTPAPPAAEVVKKTPEAMTPQEGEKLVTQSMSFLDGFKSLPLVVQNPELVLKPSNKTDAYNIVLPSSYNTEAGIALIQQLMDEYGIKPIFDTHPKGNAYGVFATVSGTVIQNLMVDVAVQAKDVSAGEVKNNFETMPDVEINLEGKKTKLKKIPKSWTKKKKIQALALVPAGTVILMPDGSKYQKKESVFKPWEVVEHSFDFWKGKSVSDSVLAGRIAQSGGAKVVPASAKDVNWEALAPAAAPKPIVVPQKKPKDPDLEKKQAWAKQYKAPEASVVERLSYLAKAADMEAAELYVRQDGDFVAVGDGTEATAKALLGVTNKGGIEKTPFGDLLIIPKLDLNAATPEAEKVKDPNGVEHPVGTQWEAEKVFQKKWDLLKNEPGIKVREYDKDDVKKKFGDKFKTIKAPGSGEKAKKVLEDLQKKYGFKEPIIQGSSNAITFLPVGFDQENSEEFTTNVTITSQPEAPKPIVRKNLGISQDVAQFGEAVTNNSDDLGNLDSIAPPRFGHPIHIGTGNTWMDGHVKAFKVQFPNGETVTRIVGDMVRKPKLTEFNKSLNPMMTLSWGKAAEGTFGEWGGTPNNWNPETGVHKMTTKKMTNNDKHFYGKPLASGATAYAGDTSNYSHDRTLIVDVPEGVDHEQAFAEACAAVGLKPEDAMADPDDLDHEITKLQSLWVTHEGPMGRQNLAKKAKPKNRQEWAQTLRTELKQKGMTDAQIDEAQFIMGPTGTPTVISNEIDQHLGFNKDIQGLTHGMEWGGMVNMLVQNGYSGIKNRMLVGNSKMLYKSGDEGTTSGDEDVLKGGAHGIFTRAMGKHCVSHGGCGTHKPKLIIHPRALRRNNWYAHNHDAFGSQKQKGVTKKQAVSGSLNLISNEVIIESIAMEDVAGFCFQYESHRTKFLQACKEQGITELNGLPLEQSAILVSNEDSNIGKHMKKLPLLKKDL